MECDPTRGVPRRSGVREYDIDDDHGTAVCGVPIHLDQCRAPCGVAYESFETEPRHPNPRAGCDRPLSARAVVSRGTRPIRHLHAARIRNRIPHLVGTPRVGSGRRLSEPVAPDSGRSIQGRRLSFVRVSSLRSVA